MTLLIAIDGPAASGKGTLSRRLAEELGLAHLDTGLTYRAVADALLKAGLPLDDEAHAVQAARDLDLSTLDRDHLAQHEIGEAASKVAVMTKVREELVAAQRRFAANPPQGKPGTVLDGRDIGTVVCPEADLKLYVTATPEERARRRWNEMRLKSGAKEGDGSAFEAVLADIRRRDERDMGREDSPLRPAADAHTLDTTEMSIDEAFAEAMRLTEAVQAR